MRIQKNDDQGTEEVTAVVPAPAVAGPKKAVEEWATAKKMLPQFSVPPDRVIPPELMRHPAVGVSMKAIASPRYNPEHAKYVAARAIRNWPIGFEVTEAEFDKAVEDGMTAQ